MRIGTLTWLLIWSRIGLVCIVCIFWLTNVRAEIFVTNFSGSFIGKYRTSTGTAINVNFVSTNLSNPYGVAVNGNNLYVVNSGSGTISIYDATTGEEINAALISNLNAPSGIAIVNNDLFVLDFGSQTIGLYDATTGATINAAFITNLDNPYGFTVADGSLFAVNYGNKAISVYDSITGAMTNAALVSNLDSPYSVVVSAGKLFVSNYISGTIGVYDANTGAVINATLISGLSSPTYITIFDNKLFVANSGNQKIGVYDANTGAVINASLIIGLNNPLGMAIVPDPPSPIPSLPTISISGKKHITTTQSTYIIKGKSTSASSVKVKIGSSVRSASGTTAWKFKAKLKPGKNIISVRAVATFGAMSPLVKMTIVRK